MTANSVKPTPGTTIRRWVPLVTVSLGTFMLMIDVTIVNVALPRMVGDLHVSLGAAQWVVDAYALTLAALVLGAGSIADLVGHRRAYVGGLALFAVSSAVCGLSPGSGVLIVARAAQGVGAAAMFATTFALLNSNYTGRDRGTAYGVWGAVAGASAALGPVIGGMLAQLASWRWIFFVNLPVSMLAIVLCLRALADVHRPHGGRVDVWGMVTFTGSASAATYALIRANEQGWGNGAIQATLAASGVLLAAFVAVERRTPYALLDLELIGRRAFAGVLIGAALLTFAAFAASTYTSIWLQSIIGMSPMQAGLVGVPMAATSFMVSIGIGRFLHGGNSGPVIGSGLLLIGAGGLISVALTHGDATWTALIPGLIVVGIGVGLATPTLGSAAMSAVPAHRGGMAAGAVNTARQLGFTFGIAALGSAFTARARDVLASRNLPSPAAAARAVAGGRAAELISRSPANLRAETASAVHASAVAGVQVVFAVAGGAGILAAAAVLLLVRRPREPEHHPEPAPLRVGDAGAEGRKPARVHERTSAGAAGHRRESP